jgi:LacI family transcriptional regulator
MMMPTIKDVAARADVSFKTVSRVLNGEPHIRSELKDRVLTAVAELGYRPTEAARLLASRKTNVIAAPVLPVAASFVSRMLISLTKECRRHRHYLLPEVLDSREHLLDWTTQMPVAPHAVILFAPYSDDMEVIDALERQKIPVVRVAQSLPGYGIPIPVSDFAVSKELMQHLLGLGHRRIGLIAPPLPAHAPEERALAYRAALDHAGIPFDDALVVRGDFTFSGGAEAARTLLALAEPPTAIFATSDDMALGVLALAVERGIKVPDELAIAGFDDNVEACKVFPALTTVYQPIEDIARVAVEAAIAGAPVPLDFKHRLVIRGSTVRGRLAEPPT